MKKTSVASSNSTERLKRDRRARRLLSAYRNDGDTGARDQVYRDHLGLAEFHAKRYAGRGIDYDDLYQEACLGLMSAIERYDPSLGAGFPTYATHCIVGSIKTCFRDRGWPCSVPRSVKSMALKVRGLKARLGGDPTREEIAEADIVPAERIEDAMRAVRVWSSANLAEDDPPASKGGDIRELSCTDYSLDQVSDRMDVESAVRRALDAEEAAVTVLYFHQELTKKEIAWRLGCSPSRVSRILRDVRKKLAHELLRDGRRVS